jgi:predicted Zn-dependent peptidase
MITSKPLQHNAARMGLALAGSMLLPVLMNAQIDRSTPPAPGPAPIVQMAGHTSFALSNGMQVIVVENHKLPLVSIQMRFDIPPVVQGDKTGYVDMVGDLLATGTTTRNKIELDEAVDRIGATFSTSNDGVFITGLRKNLDEMLAITADVVKSPTFPADEFEKVRTRYLSSLQQRKSDPDAIAEAVGRSVTFTPTHPYGEVMTEKSLTKIEPGHMQAYYQRFFRPELGYLVFVGDITAKEAKKLAKSAFGKWNVPSTVISKNEDGSEEVKGLGTLRYLRKPRTASGTRRVMLVDRPGAAQSVIRVSFPLDLQPRDIRALNAQVMNTILGGGVFNARLMQNLRENKAFTYGAYSNLESDRFNGSFTASVSVRTEVTDSAITEIIKELERLRNEPVTAEELDLAKKYMAGSFARSLEDPRTAARFALNTYLNGLEKEHYATYLQRLEAVTLADVQAAANAFLHPDNATIFVVGDKEKIAEGLVPLSMQTNMPIMQLDENGERWREPALERVTDRSAEDIIEAYLKALGGREAIAKVKDLRMDLKAEMGGIAIVMTNWYGSGGTFRSETKMGPTVVQEIILDGERAVSKGPQGTNELEDIDLEEVRRSATPVPEMDMSKVAERLVVVGRTKIGERDAFKVHLTTLSGTTISDYYDAENGLRLRREEERSMGGRTAVITTDYSDHVEASGVLFPRSITQSGGPMGVLSLTVTDVAVNKGTLPGFFETGLPPRE